VMVSTWVVVAADAAIGIMTTAAAAAPMAARINLRI
jgi:hypothetical protein